MRNNSFTVTANKSYALVYAIYEMVGSLYKASHFKNESEESRLAINFRLLPLSKQYELEDKVLSFISTNKLIERDTKVDVYSYRVDGVYNLCFRDYINPDLIIEVTEKGSIRSL